jgi:hypothetical protein
MNPDADLVGHDAGILAHFSLPGSILTLSICVIEVKQFQIDGACSCRKFLQSLFRGFGFVL